METSKHFGSETMTQNNLTEVRGISVSTPGSNVLGGNKSVSHLPPIPVHKDANVLPPNPSLLNISSSKHHVIENENKASHIQKQKQLEQKQPGRKLKWRKPVVKESVHVNGLNIRDALNPQLQKLYDHGAKQTKHKSIWDMAKFPFAVFLIVLFLTLPVGESMLHKYVCIFGYTGSESNQLTMMSHIIRALIVGVGVFLLTHVMG